MSQFKPGMGTCVRIFLCLTVLCNVGLVQACEVHFLPTPVDGSPLCYSIVPSGENPIGYCNDLQALYPQESITYNVEYNACYYPAIGLPEGCCPTGGGM